LNALNYFSSIYLLPFIEIFTTGESPRATVGAEAEAEDPPWKGWDSDYGFSEKIIVCWFDYDSIWHFYASFCQCDIQVV